MRGYISVVGVSSGKVPVESRVGIYRDPDETQEVRAVVDGQVQGLDVADPTVSRKQDEQAPVVVAARDDCLEVRNEGNTNGVTVRTNRAETDLDTGQVERVRRDASVEIGYQTELKVTVEREARVEVREGDYVAGDKVEQNTDVVDSVVNRSDVGAGASDSSAASETPDGSVAAGGDTVVEDSVVNRSDVGAGSDPVDAGDGDADDDSDTKEFCEDHQRAYTDRCPECVRERRSGEGGQSQAEDSFCIHCGERIPEHAHSCPGCGAQH